MRPEQFTIVGVDEVEWPIGEIDEPGTLIRTLNPTGLGGAGFSHDDDQNANQAGVSWRDTMYDPNVIGMTIRSQLMPGDQAVSVEKALRRSLGFQAGRRLGEFWVDSFQAGQPHRRFQVWRLASVLPSPTYSVTQRLGYFEIRDVALRSDESWWRTDPYVRTLFAADFAGATVDNVSDEDVWPHFALTGPITSPTLGLNGEAVSLPTIGAGQTWTIETDPNWFEIHDHTGADRTWPGRRWYKKAPAGTLDIPLTITGTGTTSATKLVVTLPQLYGAAA